MGRTTNLRAHEPIEITLVLARLPCRLGSEEPQPPTALVDLAAQWGHSADDKERPCLQSALLAREDIMSDHQRLSVIILHACNRRHRWP
jgi:hypothetical protein